MSSKGRSCQTSASAQSHSHHPLAELGHACFQTSLVAQTFTRLPTMWETQLQPLNREDSSGEGNGNLLQYSSLGNPMHIGAWVHGVTKRWT